MTTAATMTTSPSLPKPTPGQVDEAVRAVLRAYLAPPAAAARNGRAAAAVDVFAGRLLGLRQAEALAERSRVVRVAPGTVITPLARDLLKTRGVDVRFVSRAEVEAVREAGEWGFTIEPTSGVLEAFRRSILAGPDAWFEVGTTLEDATGWVRERGARGALVLTDEASVAVYRACQVRGVRAASADGPDAVVRAVRALGVNLLVVEPAGKSIAWLSQIGRTFRRAGGPVAPEWVETREGVGR